MGEYADYEIERIIDRNGNFSREDRFFYAKSLYKKGTVPKKCKYCGEEDLYWQKTKNGWKLFKGKEIHNCKTGE